MVQIIRTAESKAYEVALARVSAQSQVDAEIAAARRRYITSIPGQEMIYTAKEDEAKAYVALAAVPVDLVDFPLLAAEVGLTAPTASELAQIWLNMAAQWRAVAASLEAIRLTAKAEIASAMTPAEVDQAVSDCLGALAPFDG